MRRFPAGLLLLLAACAEPAPTAPPVCAGAGLGDWEFLGLKADTLAYVKTVATDPHDPARILAGTAMNFTSGIPGRLFLSEDDGQTWEQVLVSRFFSGALFDPAAPGTAYAASATAVYKSTDGGQTWAPSSAEICTDWESAIQFLKRDPSGALYAGVSEINSFCDATLYRSEDGGQTWTDLCPRPGCSMANGPISLAIDPSDADRLFVGLNGSPVVLRSEDRGATWAATGYDVGTLARGLVVDGADPQGVYASYGGFEIEGAVTRSLDGGQTWSDFSEGLPEDTHGGSLIQDQETGDLFLLEALFTTGSLWGRAPGAAVWERAFFPTSELLTNGALHLSADRFLYVGSYGLWRRDVGTVLATEPGPCNP